MKMNIQSLLNQSIVIYGGLLLGLLSPQVNLYSQWTTPEVISFSDIPPNFFGDPVLVVNPQGNAVCVWLTHHSPVISNQAAVASSFYTAGVGWAPAQYISNLGFNEFHNPLFTAQRSPDIAMNTSNYAVAVWQGEFEEGPLFPGCISYALMQNDVWSPSQLLFTGPGEDIIPYHVNVALNDAGTALAGWRLINNDTGDEFTQISFLPFGGTWSTPFQISLTESAIGTFNKPFPSINQSGDAVVCWQSRFGNTFGVGVATYKASSNTWSSPVYMDPVLGNNNSEVPRSAIDAKGNAVVTWQNNNVIKVVYFDGTNWQPPVDLSSPLPFIFDNADVVMDPAGNAIVVWDSIDDQQVYSSSRQPDGSWSSPQVISSPGTQNSFLPHRSQLPLAISRQGDIMAVWFSNPFTLISDFRSFDPEWRAPETITQNSISDYLNVGLTSCGFAVAAWLEFDNNNIATAVKASVRGNLLSLDNATVKQCKDKFATQTRCVNILKWDPSPCAASYNIYRDGSLIGTVKGNRHKFADPTCCKSKHNYTITFVNDAGFEGESIPFTIR